MTRLAVPLLALALLTGCTSELRGSDGASANTAARCPTEVRLPEPASTPTSSPGPTRANPPGDIAPHEVENNGWKVRKGLSPDDRQAGATAVEKIRKPLESLCGNENFTVDATRRALADAGFTDPQVNGLRDGSPGVFYAFRVGAACVQGDLTPGRVRAFVDGVNGEGSCVEVASH
ncbi:hypothetical protein Lesp02_22500 [Lentzea sp. NBRC 105346]|uniref:hypothetical protein n=1 Tax=Lentzea sp. NBRC 105346 TaxID=3032205 RepID=UPI0024A29C08|nr:hypothetical protein [Lentzea sp. NBRC 105346]GLZ30060.1 hypothetical protein Lesp02_22500 [Lentzea sp. NBRC 105346]